MRVLVTGISGRIGANLAKALLGAGHEVRGLVWPRDLRLGKLQGMDVDSVQGTLASAEDVERAVDGVDAICHLGAAFQGGGPFTEAEYFEINVRGTFNVLEAARRRPNRVSQVLFAGTDAAYDKYIPGGMEHPIREDEEPLRPRGWYPLSKVLGEEMCLGYYRAHDLPVTVLRFALTVAGDELLDYRQFWLSYWRDAYRDKGGEAAAQVRAELQGTGEEDNCLVLARDEEGRSHKKHIADVRDIVHGLLCALGQPAAVGEVFQLAGPAPFTWEEAVPYMAERLGVPYIDVRLAGQVPTYYEFDLAKCRRLLGFEPQYDIFRMIDSAVAFRRGEPVDVIPTHLSSR
jgi:UDP-glucose 4-epimerase